MPRSRVYSASGSTTRPWPPQRVCLGAGGRETAGIWPDCLDATALSRRFSYGTRPATDGQRGRPDVPRPGSTYTNSTTRRERERLSCTSGADTTSPSWRPSADSCCAHRRSEVDPPCGDAGTGHHQHRPCRPVGPAREPSASASRSWASIPHYVSRKDPPSSGSTRCLGSLRITITGVHTAASAGLLPPHACKQRP